MKHSGSIIKNPRITEKATLLIEKNAYTFDVAMNATKKEIMQAVKALYKVTPVEVRTLKVQARPVNPRGRRGKPGMTSVGKKAYVYLKKGDKIEVL
ncbi:MAG: 50S ribosomal protein L23 [Candidatus Pacebacteria bacterium]|nr:50S ribosomal protein L23 [Candidatus Paceibacterota bacterium]